MAKKNSSKTATKEALQAAEPRMQVFTGWQGMNIANAPDGWVPMEDGDDKFNQDDLKPNFLMIQNNIVTTDNMTLETRPPSYSLATPPNGYEFTGVACLVKETLFVVAKNKTSGKETLWRGLSLNQGVDWSQVQIYNTNVSGSEFSGTITEIGYYQKKLIVLTSSTSDQSYIYLGDLVFNTNEVTLVNNRIHNPKYIYNPGEGPLDSTWPWGLIELQWVGMYWYDEDHGPGVIHGAGGQEIQVNTRITIYISYVTEVGSTTVGTMTRDNETVEYSKSIYVDRSPAEFTYQAFLRIKCPIDIQRIAYGGVTGIDFYCSINNATEKVFIGHYELPEHDGHPFTATFDWFGSLTDVKQWTDNQTGDVPKENTTKGVPATHFSSHDSKLFFWGNSDAPYRLYVGGLPGHEISVARGYGGSWVDIEPGSGYEVRGTAKWKTVQGASIVTVMCGNPNTNRVKRFNLVETSTTFTNEISSKSYMYEEVPNVVGCNSRWGYGVFGDGLYSIGRYGLMLTTMAMEYNSQMRAQSVSDAIKPIFINNLGENLNDARMICIDDVVYIILSNPDLSGKLDEIILCYDLNLKAWYTFTYDYFDDPPHHEAEHILHMMPLDSQRYSEGICIITKDRIRVYPTAGLKDVPTPHYEFDVLMETGELMSRQPKQDMHYIQQLEFRFDYYVGDCTIYIDGVDYYGRPFRITKQCSQEDMQRDWTEWIRIERYVESYRIRLEGKARFRLVSINAKAYTTSKRISLPYGYDAMAQHRRRPGDASMQNDHHEIKSYNDLRRALVT